MEKRLEYPFTDALMNQAWQKLVEAEDELEKDMLASRVPLVRIAKRGYYIDDSGRLVSGPLFEDGSVNKKAASHRTDFKAWTVADLWHFSRVVKGRLPLYSGRQQVSSNVAVSSSKHTGNPISMEKSVTYCGHEAVKRFAVCLNSLMQNDATGGAYAIVRNEDTSLSMVPFTGCGIEGVFQDLANNVDRLHEYQMIVIDSGNSHGDSWIATFHPKQMVMSFVDEHLSKDKSSILDASTVSQSESQPEPVTDTKLWGEFLIIGDGTKIFPGQLVCHSEFGEVEARRSDDHGWHYVRMGYAGCGSDFKNLSSLQAASATQAAESIKPLRRSRP